MTSMSARGGMAAVLGVLLSAPVMSQAPAPAPAPAAQSADPMKEVVCEKQQVLGSRLQSKKVCRTRAEWADVQRQDREELERKQTERGMLSGG